MGAYKRHVDSASISDLTVARLSVYLRCVERLLDKDLESVLAGASAPLQPRSPRSGIFRRVQGARGRAIPRAPQYIVEILGLNRERRLVIVGAGNLGTALCHYSGFSGGSFLVVGVLDSDPDRIGDPTPSGLLVEDAARLPEIVKQRGAEIGVITTPPASAQVVCDWMVAAGLRTVLNFAPIRVKAPEGVYVKTVDLKVHLEELSFHITNSTSGR
jgi:redox-sensing transcriptional repressor